MKNDLLKLTILFGLFSGLFYYSCTFCGVPTFDNDSTIELTGIAS